MLRSLPKSLPEASQFLTDSFDTEPGLTTSSYYKAELIKREVAPLDNVAILLRPLTLALDMLPEPNQPDAENLVYFSIGYYEAFGSFEVIETLHDGLL